MCFYISFLSEMRRSDLSRSTAGRVVWTSCSRGYPISLYSIFLGCFFGSYISYLPSGQRNRNFLLVHSYCAGTKLATVLIKCRQIVVSFHEPCCLTCSNIWEYESVSVRPTKHPLIASAHDWPFIPLVILSSLSISINAKAHRETAFSAIRYTASLAPHVGC